MKLVGITVAADVVIDEIIVDLDTIALITSNEEIKYVMKIDKSLDEFSLLKKKLANKWKRTKHKQKGTFLILLLVISNYPVIAGLLVLKSLNM